MTYGVTGTPANVYGTFGAGNDSFALVAGTEINELLRLDFGGGAGDDFFNMVGDYTHNVSLFYLQGFDSFYTVDNDRLKDLRIGASEGVQDIHLAETTDSFSDESINEFPLTLVNLP